MASGDPNPLDPQLGIAATAEDLLRGRSMSPAGHGGVVSICFGVRETDGPPAMRVTTEPA